MAVPFPNPLLNPFSGIEDLIRMITGQRLPLEQTRSDLLGMAATAPPPPVAAVEPDPLSKGQIIGMSLADALSTYAAGMNPRVAPGNTLQNALMERRRRAEMETQRQQRSAEQGAATQRQRAALEYERGDRDLTYRRQVIQNERSAARADERLASEMEFQARQADIQRAHEMDLAQLRQSDPKAAQRIEDLMLQARTIAGGVRGNIEEELKAKTPEQLREEYEMNLEVLGLTGVHKDAALAFFDKWVSPLFPKEEEAEKPEPFTSPSGKVYPSLREYRKSLPRAKGGGGIVGLHGGIR